MTVVSWGRAVLFSVWPFFLLWVECLTFYYFFSPRVAVHCCHCEWSVWRKQTFLCAFIFYEILFWRELMVWPKRYKHEPPASTVLWGVFFFLFLRVLGTEGWGRRCLTPLTPPPPRFSGGPGGGSSDKSTMRQLWIWVWNKRKERDTASTNC